MRCNLPARIPVSAYFETNSITIDYNHISFPLKP
jgi:hypothetical protein